MWVKLKGSNSNIDFFPQWILVLPGVWTIGRKTARAFIDFASLARLHVKFLTVTILEVICDKSIVVCRTVTIAIVDDADFPMKA